MAGLRGVSAKAKLCPSAPRAHEGLRGHSAVTGIVTVFAFLHGVVKMQQLELDMEQQTGSKLEKEYVKAIYGHTADLICM